MKKLLFFIVGLLVCSEVAANCTYSGTIKRQTLVLNPKILTDISVPVGTILYSQRFGTGAYKTFTCQRVMNDQYIVDMGANVVPGVTGIQGLPVYETGIDGIGFQATDLVYSQNGSLRPAVAGSILVPTQQSDDSYKGMVIWLIKTKARIDTSGLQTIVPQISYSAGNMNTNPNAQDRLFYTAAVKLTNITFRETSCNVSVNGPSVVRLETIQKSDLMKGTAGNTGKQKTITLDMSCPANIVGKKITYWFNPRGTTVQEGVVDNMLSGPTAASNVGIIFKTNGKAITFFDLDKYNFSKVRESETISFTADYYRKSNKANDILAGQVKAMIEVVIQED